MYEVIWSCFYSRHIVRPIKAWSIVESIFIGTQAECETYLKGYRK